MHGFLKTIDKLSKTGSAIIIGKALLLRPALVGCLEIGASPREAELSGARRKFDYCMAKGLLQRQDPF